MELKAGRARRDVVSLTFTIMALISALSVPGNVEGQKPPTLKPTVALRVLVNNRMTKEGESVSLRAGQSVQLAVQIAQKDGNWSDVTTNPRSIFVSATPWVVSVSNTGLVTASGPQEPRGSMPEYDVGAVGVRYGNPGDSDIGGASMLFEISPSQETANAVGLHIKPPKTTLRVGETVPLTVIENLPDGSTRDLTSPSAGTTYDTTSESMLIPEPDGRVTCISTHAENWEVATVAAQNGKLRSKVRLKLVADGPGPGLEIVADKRELHEGEKAQLHVFKSLPGGGRKELTNASTGTRYLTFTGYGFIDPSVIRISDTGLASAADSIGHYNYRTVIVFVRNGDSVGWIELKVTHASGK